MSNLINNIEGAEGPKLDKLSLPGPGETISPTPAFGHSDQAHAEGSVQEPKGLIPGIDQEKVETPQERFAALWRGLELVLNHHQVPSDVLEDARNQCAKFLTTESEEVFVKRAKYLLALYMAIYTRSEHPPKADVAYAATGKWKKWIRTRMVCRVKNTHLWYSWFQCKRCASTLSSDMILKTYKKHREAMGKPDPITAETRERVMGQLRPLLRELRRKLMKIYVMDDGSFDETDDCVDELHVASLRACYEASRAKGGQMGALLELLNADRLLVGDVTQREEFSEPILDHTVILPVCADKVVRPFAFTPVSRFPAGEAVFADAVVRQAREDLSFVSLQATIQAVLEPLKVRVISKGNAAPYYLAKTFQKKLHGIMREYPFFRLIGRKLCPTDLFDLRANKMFGGTGPFGFASIDFSAATDNLSASLSEEIMEELTRDFPDWWRDLLMQCLAPHFCEYPKVDGEQLDPIQQENGQLMGSIVSFLVLCLANVGVTLAATAEEDPMDWYSRLKGVLINGDDNGFVCRRSVYQTFARVAGACGLEMSVGKAYWHPTIFNINSQCFHFNLVDPTATPVVVPYLNTGLFFGKGKVMGGTDSTSDPRVMSSVINEVVGGARAGKQCSILKQYLSLHKEKIAEECRGRNLFVPIALGGMGIEKPVGFETKLTFLQQANAGRILAENPNLWLGFGPLPAETNLEERPQPEVAPWLAPAAEKKVLQPIHVPKYRKRRIDGKLKKLPILVTKDGIPYRALGQRKCFQAANVCAVRRPDSEFVPYKNSRMEDMFATWLITTTGSVFTLDELALTASRVLPPMVVHHRDRDCTIDPSLSSWSQMGRSLILDIEMDAELDTFLTAVAWVSTQ